MEEVSTNNCFEVIFQCKKKKRRRRKKCHGIYWGKAGQKGGVPKRRKFHIDGNKFI